MNQHLAENQCSDDVGLFVLPKELRLLPIAHQILPIHLGKAAQVSSWKDLSSFVGVVRCLAMWELEHPPW